MLKILIYYIDDQTYEIANHLYEKIKENIRSYVEQGKKEKTLTTSLFQYKLKDIKDYNRGLKPDVIICPKLNSLNKEQLNILLCNSVPYQTIIEYELQDGEIVYGKNYNRK